MHQNTPNYNSKTDFGVLGLPGGAWGGQNLQGGVVGHFPPPKKFLKKFPGLVLVIRTYWGVLWEWFLTSPFYPPTHHIVILSILSSSVLGSSTSPSLWRTSTPIIRELVHLLDTVGHLQFTTFDAAWCIIEIHEMDKLTLRDSWDGTHNEAARVKALWEPLCTVFEKMCSFIFAI